MNDDNLIVLSDDSNESYKSENEFLKKIDNCKLKDKEDSDFSDSEFPIVRFSEINYRPSLDQNVKKTDLDNFELSDCNFDNKSDPKESNLNIPKINTSPLLENNLIQEVLKDNNEDPEDWEKFSENRSINDLYMEDIILKEWSYTDFPGIDFDYNDCVTSNSNNIQKSDNDSDYESQQTVKPSTYRNLQVEETLPKNGKKVETKTKKRRKKDQSDDVDSNNKESNDKPTKKQGQKRTLKKNPKDCIKLMEIVVDKEIEKSDFFDSFFKVAEEAEIQCTVQSQIIPKSITWFRKVEDSDTELELDIIENMTTENQILIIWDCDETVNHVFNNTFISAIESIKSLVPGKKLTLVIYKIQNYFKFMKNYKNKDSRKSNSGNDKSRKRKSKGGKGFANLPKISRKNLEDCLVKIQILHTTQSRFIESEDEMILLIQQFTKALAALPSKLEKEEELSDINWCISCDNKDTVKIDKDGNGSTRLWQQQLCQFALTSLETSEAIATVYKSPLQLIEAYSHCTESEGEALLKDIPIRRHAGKLTSTKRIGPELSKKVYLMFSATDGNICLNG